MFTMATRIRRTRVAAGMTQGQLASLVGVRRSAVAQWECSSGTHPSVAHLAQIAVAVGVSFEWLATGRGESRPADAVLEVSALMNDYAQDATESKALELLRRLSPKRREAACSILEILVS